MDGHHPKRRKDKYNPYTICTTEDGRHWLTFSDGQGNRHHFEISAAVFTLFDTGLLHLRIDGARCFRKHGHTSSCQYP